MARVTPAHLLKLRFFFHLDTRVGLCPGSLPSGVSAWDPSLLGYGLAEGFPGGSDGKESAYSDRDPALILGQEVPLENGMETHTSILAWRIPWTEEPGGI